MRTRDPVLTALNEHEGTDDDVWEDVIYPHPGYDEAATRVALRSAKYDVAIIDGVSYWYYPWYGWTAWRPDHVLAADIPSGVS